MAQVKNSFSPDQFEYSRLLSILNQAKIKTGDNPSYEVIKQLIKGNENWSQFSQLTYPSLLFPGTSIDWGSLIAELEAIITAILIASVWTKDDESASLADSRQVIAGTGITLNYGTPNQVTISSSGGSGSSSGMMALDGDQGEEAFPIPGPRGEAGPTGTTGHSTLGFLFLDGDQGEESFPIPGPTGPSNASDWVKIEEQTPSATGTLTFSALTTLYTHLEIRFSARSTRAAFNSEDMLIRFNADNGANYDSELLYNSSATVAAAHQQMGGTSGLISVLPAATASADRSASGAIRIYDYRGTTFYKVATADEHFAVATTYAETRLCGVTWRNAAAITSITLLLGSGNYVAGSKFSLYGLK